MCTKFQSSSTYNTRDLAYCYMISAFFYSNNLLPYYSMATGYNKHKTRQLYERLMRRQML